MFGYLFGYLIFGCGILHESASKFKEMVFDRFGFEVDVHEFPESTKTAEGAADAIGCDVSQIGKNIVMKVEDDLVVIVTSGSNRVSEEKLGSFLNVSSADIRTAGPEEIKDKTGWSIGGVPPFCHDEEVMVILDKTLMGFDTVWTAAGTPNTVFPISSKKLKEFADAEVAEVAE